MAKERLERLPYSVLVSLRAKPRSLRLDDGRVIKLHKQLDRRSAFKSRLRG